MDGHVIGISRSCDHTVWIRLLSTKLLLLPVIVYVSAYYVFNFETMTTTTLVILSACPTGVNAYLIAKQQEDHQETVAGTIMISTMFSTITIPLWLWWLTG